jgi:outer membrane receptor for ferrienterochelin and colicins
MDCIRRKFWRAFCILLVAINPFWVFAQNDISIYVSDSIATRPLSDAVVRITPLSKSSKYKGNADLTDRNGKFAMPFTEPVIAYISYLGYQPIIDTFRAPESRTYELRKTTANMDDVVVTGQYNAGSAKASVYEVKIYTEREIREKGATNLREALQGSLDIDVSEDPVFGSGISLQGISGEGVKILLDGVPLVGRTSGILDISQIDMTNIERIEVIKGPMSAIYGPDAMGGVINLITKSNQKEKYTINLKGHYESVGKYNVSLNGGLHIGKSQLFISGGRNFFDGYSEKDTSRHKDWLPKEQYFANAKYVYNTGKFKVGASLSFMRELMLDRGNLQPNADYAYDYHYLTYRPVATLFGTAPIKDYSRIELLLSYSGYFQFINAYQKNLVNLSEHIRTDQTQDTSTYHDIVARAVYILNSRNRRVSFQAGVDIDQEYSHQSLLLGADQNIGDYAVFSSALFRPVIGLDIQPALRFSYNTKYNTPLIPSLNIKYDFKKYFTLRASYGMGYRAPSLQELFLSFHDSNHSLDGNPNLSPEKGNSVSLEFDFHIRKGDHLVKLTNTGFFNQIKNKIDYIQTGYTVTASYQYFNINSYTNAGAEHVLQYDWKRLSLSAGVNYIWYQVDLGQSSAPTQRMISPDATFRGGYKIPKAEIGIILAYKYSGRKFLYSITGGNADEVGYINSYHSLDVSLVRNFWKDRIQLTCGAKNLLNVNTVSTFGAQAFGHQGANGAMINMGRIYFVSLNLHFAK